MTGDVGGKIIIEKLYLPENGEKAPKIVLNVIDDSSYSIEGDGFNYKAKVGELIENKM